MIQHAKTILPCILAATSVAVVTATVAAQPSTSQIDNGFTGDKMLQLPSPSVPGRIVDQVVIDTGYGGSDPGHPDVFTLLRTDVGDAVVFDVYKIDQAALDYGRVASSPPIRLPGEAMGIASATAAGLEAEHGFGSTYPPIWIGYNGDEGNGVAMINSANFAVVSHVSTGQAVVKALLAIDTPHNGTDAPATDAALPDLLVAVTHDGRNEIRLYHTRTGELLRTFPAPEGNITAMAAATMRAKSAAVDVGEDYPWVVLATESNGASTLTLLQTQAGQRNGGPLAAPPGIVTGISIVDTAMGGLDADRPDIYVSYVTPTGENQIAVYHSYSNVLLVTYPSRTPAGDLRGFHARVTALNLGIGGEGYATLFYAVGPDLPGP